MIYRKNRLFRTAVIVFALLLISSVIGCGQKGPKDIAHSSTNSYTEPDASAGDDASALDMTEHIYKEYGDYFLLDADVTVAAEPVDSLYATAVKFDPATVLDMFMQGKNPTPEKTEYNEIYYNTYDGEEHLEHMSIGGDGGFLVYRNIDFTKWIKFPTENFVTQKEYAFSNNGNPPYPTVYKQENLSFMSANDAVAEVRGILSQLGIATTEDVDVFAIDSASMQAHQAVMIEKDPGSAGFYNLKEQFTEDDEFYILCFTAECGSLPVGSVGSTVNDRYISGSEITVYYSKQGIVNLYLSGIYTPQGGAEKHEDLLTAAEAADAAFQHYDITMIKSFGDIIDEWLNGGKYVVIKMDFVYAPTAYSDDRSEVLLVPAWELTVKWNTFTDDYYGNEYDICDVLTVNAVTGEIM